MYWKEPFEQKKPKNPYGFVACGIISMEKEEYTKEFCYTSIWDFLWPEEYWSSMNTDKQKRFKAIKEKNLLAGGVHLGTSITSAPFDKRNRLLINIMGDDNYYTKPWTPLGILRKNGFRSLEISIVEKDYQSLERTGISPIEYEKVQWLISWYRKAFMVMEAYFACLETNDYITSFKQKDLMDYVYGLTFYGREMVETIGRERLLSAPVYKVEELENGGIMLQLQENPIAIIDWRFRKKIMNHLGLKPKKYVPPEVSSWLDNTKPPTGIREPKKRETSVVVGLDAREIVVKENLSLFDYFHEHVFPRVRGEVEPEFAFYKWFNKLETGLKAFLSGSWENEEFKVFVGEKVGGISGIRSWKKELSFTKLKKVERSVREKFKALNIKEEPLAVFLLYDFLEEE